jgi:hypothetical protein
MKIGFTAPGCGPGAGLDFPTRGEGRWSLNWMHILREEGHEINQVCRFPARPETLDWYLNVPWAPNGCCYDGRVNFSNHAHLRYGPIKDDSFFKAVENEHSSLRCFQDGTGSIVFGYKNNYYDSLPAWVGADRSYNAGLMPIPFSDSMFTGEISNSFNRSGIVWMSKEVFHKGQFERNSYVPDVGLVFLRALSKFSEKVDFDFHFILTGQENFPEEAKNILDKLNTKFVNLLNFTDLLALMSTAKINLGVAGMASSTIDSLFSGAVPLGHVNGFMTDTIREELPEGVLPPARNVTEDQVYNLLERLWFDKKFHRGVSDCYQEEFSVHRKENALRWFYSFVESVK